MSCERLFIILFISLPRRRASGRREDFIATLGFNLSSGFLLLGEKVEDPPLADNPLHPRWKSEKTTL